MTEHKRIFLISFIFLLLLIFSVVILYKFNFIPHRQYSNADFNIETYRSSVDQDQDGLDDQTDILSSARAYLASKPKYQSKYYAGGYPDDGYGVCTDVVAFALRDAGYDLKELVNADIIASRDKYNIDIVDQNIDYRRVGNLDVYFKNHAISLTTDLSQIDQWQGGDIIVFKDHIGIISDQRNHHGVPFLLHHYSPIQATYEEDVLELYQQDYILGHYRIS